MKPWLFPVAILLCVVATALNVATIKRKLADRPPEQSLAASAPAR